MRKTKAQVLSPSLRHLVHDLGALLGDVLKKELGSAEYQRIEKLRLDMTKLRGSSPESAQKILRRHLQTLCRLSAEQRLNIAKAFTLLLELMNACENAYRSHQIQHRAFKKPKNKPDSIIYVLTAHPTEARAKENIWIFHSLLQTLVPIFDRPTMTLTEKDREILTHQIELAWNSPIVRGRKPRVQDEAEHVYSTVLRDETLKTLLTCSEELAPIYIRSWVGGDKDGHPGVDEKVFKDSLTLSRQGLLEFLERRILEVRESLEETHAKALLKDLLKISRYLISLRQVQKSDAKKVLQAKKLFYSFFSAYEKKFHILHPSLHEIKKTFHLFPALVVPLEFREDSGVLMSSPSGKGLAIFRMLNALRDISSGGDPRWYVRAFIISMASDISHIKAAAHLCHKSLGALKLPIAPLFEQRHALEQSSKIVEAVFKDTALKKALHQYWGSRFEVMLGYSDSSKESGVLESRLIVAEAMHRLDHLCEKHHVLPLFFQGSGGSIDRGGGSISEQTAWWSTHALRNYKVTVQGEMVERSLANPQITRGQFEHIAASAGEWKAAKHRHLKKIPALDRFADQVARSYHEHITSPEFLKIVELATPYPFLNLLKIGSRPTKRSTKLSVDGLRAIPWILCWTQTRFLFPTWWGIGSAWKKTSTQERKVLIQAAKTHPLFKSYVRALGFTVAKIETEIWKLYLEESTLSKKCIRDFEAQLTTELKLTKDFLRATLGTKDLIPSRPWLQEAIWLRSPMIHPLNLLQILSMQKNEVVLLRTSVTGISSGMMTTG